MAKKKNEFLLPAEQRGVFLGGEKLDMGNRTKDSIFAKSAMLEPSDPNRGVFRAAANAPSGKLIGAASGRVSPAIGGRPSGTGNLRTGIRTGAQAGGVGTPRPVMSAASVDPTASRKPTINDHPELARMARTRAATNPGRIRLFARGGGKDEDRVAAGFAPKSKNPDALVVRAYQKMQAQAEQLRIDKIAEEKSGIEFARKQEMAKATQEAMGNRQLKVGEQRDEQKLGQIAATGEERIKQIQATATERLKGQFAAGELPGTPAYDTKVADELTKMAQEAEARMEQATGIEDIRIASREAISANAEANRMRLATAAKTKETTYTDDKGNVAGTIKQEKSVKPGAAPAVAPTTPATQNNDSDGNGVQDNLMWRDPVDRVMIDANKLVNWISWYERLTDTDPRKQQRAAQYVIEIERRKRWMK